MATTFTKKFFSADNMQNDPDNTVLKCEAYISGSGQTVTNLGNLFSTVNYASVVSGNLAAKNYWVGVSYGAAASTAVITVLSSAIGANITGSVDIGTLSDKITLGLEIIGAVNTSYTGSTTSGA